MTNPKHTSSDLVEWCSQDLPCARYQALEAENERLRERVKQLSEGWTCYHCGETFTTSGAARDHFGFDPTHDPGCRIKLGAERGLLMALRKAEADLEEMRRLLHDEASEAYRLYAAQTTRHRAQLMAAEEEGYERGLADARAALKEDTRHD